MRDAWADIHARGAGLVVVGSGTPVHARTFRQAQAIDVPLLVDPDLVAFRAAGLRRGLASTFSPRVLGHAVRAWRTGARQGRTQGDPWQQGGTFVIAPPATVRFAHVSREAGDHPPVSAILAALEPET